MRGPLSDARVPTGQPTNIASVCHLNARSRQCRLLSNPTWELSTWVAGSLLATDNAKRLAAPRNAYATTSRHPMKRCARRSMVKAAHYAQLQRLVLPIQGTLKSGLRTFYLEVAFFRQTKLKCAEPTCLIWYSVPVSRHLLALPPSRKWFGHNILTSKVQHVPPESRLRQRDVSTARHRREPTRPGQMSSKGCYVQH